MRRTLSKDVKTRDYGDECIVLKRGTQEVRCPAHPSPVTYIRVISDGQEVVYWTTAEWQADHDVMGAILGCVKQVAEGKPVSVHT